MPELQGNSTLQSVNSARSKASSLLRKIEKALDAARENYFAKSGQIKKKEKELYELRKSIVLDLIDTN